MRRRKFIFGILALVVCGVLAVAFWPEKPEPVYKGKKLSYWAQSLATNINTGEMEASAVQAIKAIGTNGIPFYLEWLGTPPSLPQRVRFEIVVRTRKLLQIQWHMQNPFQSRQQRAFRALEGLGEGAAPAIPQLAAYATNFTLGGMNQGVSETATEILADMGPPAVPALLSLLTNDNPRVRLYTIFPASESKDRAVRAQVRKALEDPDPKVRRVAAVALNRTKNANSDEVDKR